MVCSLIEKDGEPNWCESHRMYHRGHYAAYAIDAGRKGERFRKRWDRIARGENPLATPPRLLRSLPLAKQCIHLGTQNPPEKAGCGSCVTWNCAIKGKVKLTHCTQECNDHEKLTDTVSNSWPLRLDEKNFAVGIEGLRFNSSIIEWPMPSLSAQDGAEAISTLPS